MVIFIFMIIFIFLVNFWFTKKYYPNEDMLKFSKITPNLKILAIGSGPGRYDIDFSDIPYAQNLSVWPQDFRYDYRIIKRYRKYFNENAIIIHAISPLSFSENIYSKSALIDRNYVRVLPMDMVDLSMTNYLVEKYMPALKHPKDLLKYIFGIKQKRSFDVNKKVLADNLLKGWLSTNPHLENFQDSSQGKYMEDAFKKNRYWLEQMIDFCHGENLIYVPVLVPMGRYLKSYFSDDFLDVFLYKNVFGVGIKENDIIDCLACHDLENDELYFNGLFLNGVGSRIMTNIILERLKARG